MKDFALTLSVRAPWRIEESGETPPPRPRVVARDQAARSTRSHRARLAHPDERTHELAVHQGRNGRHVDPLAVEELPGVFAPIDASRFRVDGLEAGRGELRSRAREDLASVLLNAEGRLSAGDHDAGHSVPIVGGNATATRSRASDSPGSASGRHLGCGRRVTEGWRSGTRFLEVMSGPQALIRPRDDRYRALEHTERGESRWRPSSSRR
jgi:hypothetical protein